MQTPPLPSMSLLLTPLSMEQNQQLHQLVLAQDQLNGTIPSGAVAILPKEMRPAVAVIDILCDSSDSRMPIVREARASVPGVVPQLIYVHCDQAHNYVDGGVEELRQKLDDAQQLKPHFDNVLNPLLTMLGSERLVAGQDDDERRITLQQLITPKNNMHKHMQTALLQSDGDKRQTASKAILLVLHTVQQIIRPATLTPAVATRSTAPDQVALTVNGRGAVTRVEMRALHNFVLDRQPELPDKEGQSQLPGCAYHPYFSNKAQNAGALFGNDCVVQHLPGDKKFVALVAEKYRLPSVPRQPSIYHHSIDGVEAFGIGMTCLHLLSGCDIQMTRVKLQKFWTKYEQVSASAVERNEALSMGVIGTRAECLCLLCACMRRRMRRCCSGRVWHSAGLRRVRQRMWSSATASWQLPLSLRS